MRTFNTMGPVDASRHYCIPPLARIDLDHVVEMIGRQSYFTLHAPPNSGKTSTLRALQDRLNSGKAGNYRCLHANIGTAKVRQADIPEAMEGILEVLAERASSVLGDNSLKGIVSEALADHSPGTALCSALIGWTQADSRPLVLLIDDLDALADYSLLSVARQIRSSHDMRPKAFPHSIVLCGVSDVRDYRIRDSSTGEAISTGSGYNISAASLQLANFDREQVGMLLGQHTEETGQRFEPAAIDRLYTQTEGQPWLVNALCKQACFENPRGRDRGRPISEDDIVEAQEIFIEERVTHLDDLAGRLREEPVQRVIEPILSGDLLGFRTTHDRDYVKDLGLVARDAPTRIANPLYAEVVPRELTNAIQHELPVEPARYFDEDGRFNLEKLLEAFQESFRANSEQWLQRIQYREAGPQVLLQAFLQRALTGGGCLEREAGIGLQRLNLLILWPSPQGMQRFAIECKILRKGLEATLERGLRETAAYLDRCAADAAHLVIFDRDEKPWKEKVYRRSEEFDGKSIEVWGM